jgi:hypothetical protein
MFHIKKSIPDFPEFQRTTTHGILLQVLLRLQRTAAIKYTGISKVAGEVTVAERSKTWTVFARSDPVIVGSNSALGMNVWCVRLFCVCVVLCVGRGLATGWSPVQGVLPTVYRSRNWSEMRVSRMPYAPEGVTAVKKKRSEKSVQRTSHVATNDKFIIIII